ncbi:hypothetical protein [Reichenbachiella sp.]|uniref:hypothetical protein n=1 Tax=Reichenbachiella sp. TaxID=2184521 RepID=UPI003B5AAC81
MTFKFNLFGWALIWLVLALCTPLFPIYWIANFDTLDLGERAFLLSFGWILMLIVIVSLWVIILTEFNNLKISEDEIEFKNILTARSKIFEKKDLRGFKTELTKGYLSINLIGKNNKTLKSIREIYYGDVTNIVKLLQLKSLDK